eukprot:CAMPEP_0197188610 /NCGR_PEP_ID=MMETSP1423-20130617/18114_1 /TAXON_ID=476441 /ORGANISM="Pseudo-nitzschia heimii, Strain UNC1101" /LENGTH=1059 /DNA_ID=CAMNT_0042640495 /DNA_START=182 /DNA_END=3361 /DNA_ORIENTATION=-
MPVSTRKRGDDKSGDTNDANTVARDHEANPSENDDMGLSKTIASPTSEIPEIAGANSSSGMTREKYKGELAVSPPELRPTDHREEVHKSSIPSSAKFSSKLAPICSSPSHAADLSRTHLFSPEPPHSKPLNNGATYDDLDLDDTMTSAEAPFQFAEESPQRELARPLSEAENANESATRKSSRKREASRSDSLHPPKRSHVVYPHHMNYLRGPEDSSENAISSSKRRNQPYYNFYGHAYPAPAYQDEIQTPSRGSHQGIYSARYSPYNGIYSEHSHGDSRPFLASTGSNAQYESDEESPPSPPLSPGPRVSSITEAVSTPENALESMAKSPFRSPPRDSNWGSSEPNSTMGYRPSPFFQRSPGISGSFDIGTPNGTLTKNDDDLGPIFQAFEDAPTPCTLRSFDGAALMSIGRSPSHGNVDETPSPSAVGRGRQQLRSPLPRHMTDLSSIDQPLLYGSVRHSPDIEFGHQITSTRRYSPETQFGSAATERSAGERKYPKTTAVTMSGTRGTVPSSRLEAGAEPKQLWPSSSDSLSQERSSSAGGTPGPVRLEIGGTGSITTRKTFEGINSMMQQRSSSQKKYSMEQKHVVSGQKSTPSRSQLPARHHGSSHHSYPVSEKTTPRKPYSHIRSGHFRHYYSYPPAHGSGRKPMYLHKMDSHYSMAGPHKHMYLSRSHTREASSISQRHRSVPPPDGKENNKKKSAPKRSPCNCKKSHCLKLYCECFAAERFCQGCNCVDCGNTPESGEIREKAIKDTRAKNSKAFQNRFSLENSQGSKSSQKVHNMGCKCKKSACLKKYCECFNAGALCGAKCKCLDCLNYAGSQALIDKRRKIKDRSGAEYALRVSDEQWKSGCGSAGRKPSAPPHRRHPMPSPVVMPPHHNLYPNPRGPPPQGSHSYSRYPSQRHYYMGVPPRMIAHGHPPHAGYAPMNMPVTPGYHRPTHRMPPTGGLQRGMYHPSRSNRLATAGNPTTKVINAKGTAASPKTPGIRKAFDPATSRKKRKTTDGESEPTEPYFGEKINQPKTTALAVFSFLSNDDLYHASLVCRRWGKLAFDDELWKF